MYRILAGFLICGLAVPAAGDDKPERGRSLAEKLAAVQKDEPFAAFFVAFQPVSLLPSLNAHEASSESKAASKKSVLQLLESQVAAWNKGDLEAFMKGYWKSPDLMFFSGKDKTRGWQATLDRYRKRYQAGDAKMGKLTFSDMEIEVLGPASAWVRGRWQVIRGKETLSGLFTLLVKKLPEGWRIVHDHTSSG